MNTAVLLITHDIGVVEEICEQVLVMYGGRVMERGTVAQVTADPKHPYTRGLLASIPTRAKRGTRLDAIGGAVPNPLLHAAGLPVPAPLRASDAGLRRRTPACATPAMGAASPAGCTDGRRASDRCSRSATCAPTTRNRGGWLGRGAAWVKAVDDVSFTIRRGETFGLVGESGCGKTTLGRSILRLERPQSGQILFEGEDLLALSPGRLKQVRRDIQAIFQDPFGSLDPRMTVRQVIAEGLIVQGMLAPRRAGSRGSSS